MQITPVLLYIGGTGENVQPQVRCRRPCGIVRFGDALPKNTQHIPPEVFLAVSW